MATVGTLIVELAADVSRFKQGLEEATARLQGVQRSMQAALPASELLLGGVTALAAAFGAAGAAGVKMAAEMEQTNIAFTTLLGSAEAAEKFLRELAVFAAKTPFEMPGLVDASRKLLAFGFEAKQIIPLMTAVGDAVAALGGGAEEINRVVYALGQMRAKGKVSAEEMMQLAELGIPAWEMLAKKIGVSIPQAMELARQGAIPAAQGIEAILSGMTERFGGAMQRQSWTILGLWSTMKDNLNMILRGLGEEIIKAFDLQGVMAKLNEQLTQITTLIQEKGLRAALAELVPPDLQQKIVIVAGALAGALVPALAKVAERVLLLARSFLALGPYAALGMALAAAGYAIYQNWDRIRPALQPLVDLWNNGLRPVIERTIEVVRASLLPTWEALKQAFYAFKPVLELVAGLFGVGLATALGIAIGVINGVARAIAPLIQAFSALVSFVGQTVQVIIKLLTGDFRGAWQSMIAGGQAVVDFFRGMWNAIVGFVKGLVDGVVNWFRSLYNALVGRSIIPELVEAIVGYIRSLPGRVLAIFVGLGERLIETVRGWWTIGQNLAEGIWQGLQNAKEWLKARVIEWAKAVLPGPLERLLGISSPSALMAYYGQMVAEGLAQGIESGHLRVKTAAEKMSEAISGAVSAVQERVSLASDIINARFELMKARMGENVPPAQALQLELQKLQQQLALTQEQAQVLAAAYERMKSLKGETAIETQRLYLELLREQKAQVELANAIAATNKELEAQSTAALERQVAGWEAVLKGVSDRAVALAEAIARGDWAKARELARPEARPETPEERERREKAERRARAWEAAIGLSYGAPPWAVSPAFWEKGLQAIRGLQTGGIVTRPTLALLGERGREAVVPLDRGLVIDYQRLAEAVAQAVSRRPQVLRAEVHVHAGDVDQVRKIITLFERLPQVARAMGGA